MRKIVLVVVIAAIAVVAGAVAMQWIRSRQAARLSHPQREMIERLIASAGATKGSVLRLQVIRPGIILPPGAETYPSAPEDLRIVVTRRGNEPAEIEVRQGEREWRVTENDLDQLPPEIRLQVERPLGWVLEGPAAKAAIASLLPGMDEAPPPAPVSSNHHLEKRLDELNARVEALFESVEQLHAK